jgi:hypothetical protein
MTEKRDIEISEGLTIKDVEGELAEQLETSAQARKDREPMDLVRFYNGEIRTGNGAYDHPDGHTFSEIMAFDYFQLESHHRWVQWMFPTKERSMLQTDIPILNDEVAKLFREDKRLNGKAELAFHKMLDFYGFEIKGGEIVVQEVGNHKNPLWAFQGFNHNYFRVTRILTALRYFGFEEWSRQWKDVLFKFASCDTITEGYWQNAAEGVLE